MNLIRDAIKNRRLATKRLYDGYGKIYENYQLAWTLARYCSELSKTIQWMEYENLKGFEENF